MYVCKFEWRYMHVRAGTLGGQRYQTSLELELQAAVSHQM